MTCSDLLNVDYVLYWHDVVIEEAGIRRPVGFASGDTLLNQASQFFNVIDFKKGLNFLKVSLGGHPPKELDPRSASAVHGGSREPLKSVAA